MNKIINLTLISKILSLNILIVSLAILFCSLIALIYSEPVYPFVFSFIVGGAASLFLYLVSRKEKNVAALQRKDAFFTVTASWILMAFLGSLPYVFSNSIPLFSDAMFESASGFTTTGSSILANIRRRNPGNQGYLRKSRLRQLKMAGTTK